MFVLSNIHNIVSKHNGFYQHTFKNPSKNPRKILFVQQQPSQCIAESQYIKRIIFGCKMLQM